jgi:hypothetical protein
MPHDSFWAAWTHLVARRGALVCIRRLDAGDVGGEEVDAVAVEVAAGAVVVLCGAGVYVYMDQCLSLLHLL